MSNDIVRRERERFAEIVIARFWEAADEIEQVHSVDERLYEAINDAIREGLGEFAPDSMHDDPGALISICKKLGIRRETRGAEQAFEERWVCKICGNGAWERRQIRTAEDAIHDYAWPIHHRHAHETHSGSGS